MICPGCGEKNRDEARFCTYCGTTLALRCSVCDNEIVPGGRFCDSCGAAVDPSLHAQAPASVAAASAARKVVTVLFADLTGSTALEERMDAESVRSILDRFYAAMRSEIERFGGRLVKFTGDGAMGAFGVPDVHEDDALRAVDAALAMRQELVELAADLQLDLSLKIGINTGEVVVSDADDDVVGDSVNVASRLEGAAGPGEILVGEDTWRLTRATSRYEPIEPLALKGKSEPVPAYRLISVDERTADSAAAPFVGRELELGRLLAVFLDAVDANAARLVTIIGSPGLGKTRLARELMSELSEQARVRETRCDPAGESTFAPVADAIRAASGISETDTEDDVIAALMSRIPEEDPDRERIARRAAAILGVGVPGSTEETFWAIRRLIECAAATQPMVLVFDDIHWAEPLLLDLIEHLAEWIRNAPVLIVGTARPELRDLRPSFVEGGRASSVVALEGLDHAATAQLALNLLGAEEHGLPSELLAKIPASTEGNPLFVRELVRMLVDDGVLVRTADGWNATVDVDAIQVPPTITSLLSARVDRLRSDERTIVELASVVGKEFYRGALQDLVPAGVKDLVDGCLESLRRKELVEPVGTYWIDEPVYRFHHVLIRDAAYRRVLKETRGDVHERVAEWLERKTANVLGEFDELIGYHLEQAHEYRQQLGRPDDALGRRAAELLRTAAQRALDRDDLPAAAALSGRALARLPFEDAERAEVLLIQCEALLSMADVVHGSAAASELELVADTPRLRAWATCFSGHVANLTVSERTEELEARLAEAASELATLGDPAGAAKAYTVLAQALAKRGRFAECEAVLDDALTAARAANDRRRITATLGFAPYAALWGPNPVSRAGGRCLDIVRLLRITTGSPAVEATSLRCQAVLEAFRGRAEAARRMLRSARRTLTDLGLEHELLEAEKFAGIVELVGDDPAAAVEHLRAAYEGFLRAGVDILAGESGALLARAHLRMGEDAEAAELIEASERLGTQDRVAQLAVKSTLLARQGSLDEARRTAEEAVELAEKTDALFNHGTACRSLAEVLRAAGDANGARRADDRARALFERKGATALIDAGAPSVLPGAEPPTSEPDALTNRCVEVIARRNDYIGRGDVDGAMSMYADDCLDQDRRRGLHLVKDGKAAIRRNIEEVALGGNRVTSTPIATRGQRLALLATNWQIEPSGYEVDHLTVAELDEDDRISRIYGFDIDDRAEAFGELEERYLAGEGAEHAQLVRTAAEMARAFTSQDWHRVRQILADDLVVVDHRPAMLGEIHGAEGWIESAKVLTSLVPYRSDLVAIHALEGDCGVCQYVYSGVTSDGATVESEFQWVFQLRGGRIVRMEPFPVDDLDATLVRFEELVGRRHAHALENASTRAVARMNECARRGDWAGVDAGYDESLVSEDRRPLFEGRAGKRSQIAQMKLVTTLGAIRCDLRTVAIRGDRLSLTELHFHGEGDDDIFEVKLLTLIEVNADGRIVRSVFFEPSDLDAAVADLDESFIAGEGAEHADLVMLARRLFRAGQDRDWLSFRRLLAGDFVVVDRRPVNVGEVRGADAFVDMMRAWEGVVFSVRSYIMADHAIRAHGGLVTVRDEAITHEGDRVESVYKAIAVVRGGCFERFEVFPDDALDEALSRFDELTGDDHPKLENASTRALTRMNDCWQRQDWAGVDEIYADDLVSEDRRPLFKGRANKRRHIAQMKVTASFGEVRTDLRTLAIRGDRLSLNELTFHGHDAGDAFEVRILGINEVDDDGRITRGVVFEPDDLDNAMAELDERFIAGQGARHETVVRAWSDFQKAYNSRDWAALRERLMPDFVAIDHRPASLGRLEGVDAYFQAMQVLIELVPGRSGYIESFTALGDRAGLATMQMSGATADGFQTTETMYNLATFIDGRIATNELYPAERLDDALARFDELTSERQELENSATLLIRRTLQTRERGDWPAFAALLAPNSQVDDMRQGFQASFVGRDEVITQAQATVSVGVVDIGCTVIAIRGQRLCIDRRLYKGPPGSDFEVETLNVCEVDDEGRFLGAVVFDADAVADAFAELDERYIATEGREHADVVRLSHRYIETALAADWGAVERLLTHDFVVVDHRLASLGEIRGRDAWLEAMRAYVNQLASGQSYIAAYHAITSDGGVGEVLDLATTDHGSEVEIAYQILGIVRDGRIARVEIFPVDELEAAVARFDELRRRTTPVLENEALRAMRGTLDALVTRDWDAYDRLYVREAVLDDRRTGLKNLIEGREAIVSAARELMALGADVYELTAIATRGDRLAMARVIHKGTGGPFESEIVKIVELDDDGRICANVNFDPDDADEAFAELDRRALALFGVPIIARGLDISEAYNARDWARLRSILADDFFVEDYRPASLGRIDGPDQWIDAVRPLTELIPDSRWRLTQMHAVDANAALCSLETGGTTPDGAKIELSSIGVVRFRDDLWVSNEIFPIDQFDRALARYRELAQPIAPPTASGPENACTRAGSRLVDAFGRRDWGVVADCFSVAAINDDRRTVLRDYLDGRDAIVEGLRHLAGVGALGLENRVIATRGNRLALSERRMVLAPDRDIEAEVLVVEETDADGRIRRGVLFDSDDIELALDELDECFIAGEGSAHEGLVRGSMTIRRAWNSGNWDGETISDAVSESVELIDHRPLGIGRLEGRDAWVAYTGGLRQTAGNLRLMHTAFEALGRQAVLVRLRLFGTNPDGGDVEIEHLVLCTSNDGYRIERLEYFSTENLDAALARFEELGPQAPARHLDNAASRTMHRWREALERGDLDALTELHTEDSIVDDRRRGLQSIAEGRDALRAMIDIGTIAADVDPLAVRGERLILQRCVFRGAEKHGTTFGSELLVVNEIAIDGRHCAGVCFDVDDLDAAFTELDRRYMTGEGAEFASTFRIVKRPYDAINRRDFEDYRASHHESIVVNDYRPASLGHIESADAVVRATARMLDIVPQYKRYVVAVHAIAEGKYVTENVFTGVTEDGGTVESVWLIVGTIRDGVIGSYDLYPTDQLQAALERYEALGREEVSELDNLAMRSMRGQIRAFLADDWDYFQTAFSPDYEYVDHRLGVGAVFKGQDEARTNLRTIRDLRAERWNFTALATRGDRLALHRNVVAGPPDSGFDVEVLVVHEVDDFGRSLWARSFDPSDIDEALKTLDRRYIEGEGRPYAEVFANVRDRVLLYNARDWDALHPLFDDGFVFVDRRPAGAGTLHGADAHIDFLKTYLDLAPDVAQELLEVVAAAPDRILCRARAKGTTREGADVELVAFTITQLHDGRAIRVESFPDDQREAALARFEELGLQDAEAHWAPENAAFRAGKEEQRLTLADDWERAAAMNAADVRYEDRRSGLRWAGVGREARTECIRASAAPGDTVRHTLLATRGERLSLERKEFHGGWESEFLALKELNEHGRFVFHCVFDPDDLAAAVAELDRRYIAGEGAPYADVLDVQSQLGPAMHRRDWDGVKALMADGLVRVDHRLVSLGRMTVDEWVSSQQALGELVQTIGSFVVYHRAIARDRLWSQVRQFATSTEGSDVEYSFQSVVQVRDGRIVVWEVFPDSTTEEARVLFERLGLASSAHVLENECVRVINENQDRTARGDIEGATALYSSNCEMDDRRAGIHTLARGREAMAANMRGWIQVGFVRYERETIAVRGDSLAVERWCVEDRTGLASEGLGLYELDDEGLMRRVIFADDGDLGLILDELDERFIATQGAEYAVAVRMFASICRAVNARHIDEFRSLIADGAVIRDHRTASLGELSADERAGAAQALIDVVPSLRAIPVLFHALAADRFWSQARLEGENQEGGHVEFSYQVVGKVDRGRLVHVEFFPNEMHDEARVLFEELGAGDTGDHRAPQNAASRAGERLNEAWIAQDWDTTASQFARDIVVRDVRTNMRYEVRGRDAAMAYIQSAATITRAGFALTRLAVAGERLALVRLAIGHEAQDQWTSEMLVLYSLNEDGLFDFTASFDIDDLDTAFEMLIARFFEGEGRAHRQLLEIVLRGLDAYRRRDWDAYLAALDDSFVQIDHRPVSAGTVQGLDAHLTWIRSLTDLADDARLRPVELVRFAGDRGLVRAVVTGTTSDGMSVESPFLMLCTVRDGRIASFEQFAVEDDAAALARFEELGRVEAMPVAVPENFAFRSVRHGQAVALQGDWDALSDRFTDDVYTIDRRSGLGSRVEGKEAVLAHTRAIFESGTELSTELIATRGECLDLSRESYSINDFTVEALRVSEVDEDGRTRAIVIFDPDNLDAAYDELDRRYFEGEGAPHAEYWAPRLTTLFRAHAERDWDRLASFFAADLRFVDHRPASLGSSIGPSLLIESVKGLVDVVPDVRIRCPSIFAIDGPRALLQFLVTGTNAEGGPVELRFWSVSLVTDGKTVVTEYFADDDLDAAIARYEELAQRDRSPLENLVTRQSLVFDEAMRTGEWEPMRTAFAADVVAEDRRRGIGSRSAGLDAFIKNFRTLRELGFRTGRYNVLATRGDRLELRFGSASDADGNLMDALMVTEANEDGLICAQVYLDADAIDDAIRELDARYLEGEGARYANTWRSVTEFLVAYNARDWAAIEALGRPGFVAVNHSPASWGTIDDPSEFVRTLRALTEAAPDIRLSADRIHAIADDIVVFELCGRGPTPDGAEIEIVNQVVAQSSDGVAVRTEMFPEGQLHGALARFHELLSRADAATDEHRDG